MTEAKRDSFPILVVDDDHAVRDSLVRFLKARSYDVMETADGRAALDLLKARPVRLVITDVRMPAMDGITMLKNIRANRMKVDVVVMTGFQSLSSSVMATMYGAADFINKPFDLREMLALIERIRVRQEEERKKEVPVLPDLREEVVAIGASTGGIQAIESVLSGLPRDFPGVLVCQHIPDGGFSTSLSSTLQRVSKMKVREAISGENVERGQVYIAPGDRHLLLRRNETRYRLLLKRSEPVNNQRPSVDVLFRSVAEIAGPHGIGVLLTGLGDDGALGLQAICRAGGRTIAQDEKSSAVFGMPRQAIELGAAQRVLPLEEIARALVEIVRESAAQAAR